MFDDAVQRQIAEQTLAALQTADAMRGLCQSLGEFRKGLIDAGFTTEGAEGLTQDYWNWILSRLPAPDTES